MILSSWTSLLLVSVLLSTKLAEGISFSSAVAPTASIAIHPPTQAPTGSPSKRSKKQKSAAFGLDDHKAHSKKRKSSRIRPENAAFVREPQKGRKQQKRQSSHVRSVASSETKRTKKSTKRNSHTKSEKRIPENTSAPKKLSKKTKHRPKRKVTKPAATKPHSETSETLIHPSKKVSKRKKSKSKIPPTVKEATPELSREERLETARPIVERAVESKKRTKRRKKASSMHSQATSRPEPSTCIEPEEATTTPVNDPPPAVETQENEIIDEESPDTRTNSAIQEDAAVEEDAEVCEAPTTQADAIDVSVAEQEAVEDQVDGEEVGAQLMEEEATVDNASPEGEEELVEVEVDVEAMEEENDPVVAEEATDEIIGEEADLDEKTETAQEESLEKETIVLPVTSTEPMTATKVIIESESPAANATEVEKDQSKELELENAMIESMNTAAEETEIAQEESPQANTEDGNDESIVEEKEDNEEITENSDIVPEESLNAKIASPDDNEASVVEQEGENKDDEDENKDEDENEDEDDEDDEDQGGDIQNSDKVKNETRGGFIDPEQDVVSFIEEVLHEDVRSWVEDTDSHAENIANKPRGGHLDIEEKTGTTTDEEPKEEPKIMDRESLEKLGDKDSDAVVSVVTWNLAEDSPSEEDAAFIRNFRENGVLPGEGSDLVLISGQECENIKPRRSEGRRSREYRRLMIKMLGRGYGPLALHLLGGIQFGLCAKRSFVKEIVDVSVADVTCGIGNVFHNKGAIAAFLTLKARNQADGENQKRSKTLRMVFVTAHLAAHVKNADARDSDFWRISSELEAQVPEGFLPRKPPNQESSGSFLFDSVDRVFFCGDLNYRLDLPRELTEHAILHGKESEIFGYLQHDQLIQSMAEGKAFPGFAEGKITFLPTFKFDKESSSYDTSHKQRIPAWTDRILFQPANGIRVLEYQSIPEAQSSDHRPVYGSYRIGMEGKVLPPAPKRKRRKRYNEDN